MLVATAILSPVLGGAIGMTSVEAWGLRRGIPAGLAMFLGTYAVGALAATS